HPVSTDNSRLKSIKSKPALTARVMTTLWGVTCTSLVCLLMVTSLFKTHASGAWSRAKQIKQAKCEMPRDREATIKSLEQDLELARRGSDYVVASDILLKLSAFYRESKELNKSLLAAEEAIAAARNTADRKREAWALRQAGNALYSLGKFTSALENFLSAVSLMRDVGDRYGEALAIKDVGII